MQPSCKQTRSHPHHLRPHPPSQHYHHCVQDYGDAYEDVIARWLLSRSATLEQQVAALRLALAVCNCWGFHYPLTEEEVPDMLQQWLMEGADTAPTIHDEAPADEAALLVEERQVYALGARPLAASCMSVLCCAVR